MSEHAAPPPAPTFADKASLYAWLEKQTGYLVEGMSRRLTPQANLVIGLGNVAALCFYALNHHADPAASLQSPPVNWFGFYLLQAPGLLALGPFQGRPACTEIRVGRGVCGTAAEQGKTLVVADVHAFPGHIACDSASNAEVVVPILSENGTVLGVIDVDSVVAGHFDEVDGRGLEAVARVLVRHLEFPMARALAVNPALGMPSFSVVASGGMGPPEPELPAAATAATAPTDDGPVLPPPPPTRVSTTAIPYFHIETVRPDSVRKELHGWSFTTTRLDRIMNQAELQDIEKRLGISAFPEVQFPFNTLAVEWGPEGSEKKVVLAFDALSVLANAASYYTSDHFKTDVGPQLNIPASESWSHTPYAKHDPGVDWAWRQRYFGVTDDEVPVRLHPMPAEGKHGINWELLKDRTLPIVAFDSFDLFEDDLHDHGMVTCSVKFRVMETAFFILFRQFVRVDGHALWLRDVRFYHEFAWQSNDAEPPYVAVEEQTKWLSLAPGAASDVPMDWRNLSIDELAQKATVREANCFYVTL